MGKTIKVIDLLNKKANGEEMPKKIKFENYIYIWRDIQKDYFCEQINHSLESIIGEYLFGNLNLEVEIVEEDKEIEKLGLFDIAKQDEDEIEPDTILELDYEKVSKTFDKVYHKINEIIDKVNSLEKNQ